MSKKPFALSPNSQSEWELLPISVRHVLFKAMKKYHDAQGILAKNSVFLEIPEKLRDEAVKNRTAATKSKNKHTADAVSIIIRDNEGELHHRHAIFSAELEAAVKEHGNDYGDGIMVKGQVLGTMRARSYVNHLASEVAKEQTEKTGAQGTEGGENGQTDNAQAEAQKQANSADETAGGKTKKGDKK